MALQVFRFYFVYMAHVSFSTLTCEETTRVHAITAKIMNAKKGKTIKKGSKFRKMAMEKAAIGQMEKQNCFVLFWSTRG